MKDKIDGLADYEEEIFGDEDEALDEPLSVFNAGLDARIIPAPRGWLLGTVFCRGFVSSLLGDGGIGKTATRYAQYLSLATKRQLTGEHVFQRCRVLIISFEDGLDELRRRIRAARLHYGIAEDDLDGWLFYAAAGPHVGKLMSVNRAGRTVEGKLGNKIENAISADNIDLVALDPFVKTHAVEENSNHAIDGVLARLTDIATRYDIAADAPHHVNKGAPDPGNANRGRGASAMKDAARLVHTLTPMSPEEAQALGVPEAERKLLIRMDSGKVNIAPPMIDAKWFRLVGIPIGNATARYPSGDTVQTVEPWIPPDIWRDLSVPIIHEVLNELDAGLPDGNRYSDSGAARERAAWLVVTKHCPTRNEAAARQIIKAWLKSGLLVRRDYEHPTDRHAVKGIWVDNSKRPT